MPVDQTLLADKRDELTSDGITLESVLSEFATTPEASSWVMKNTLCKSLKEHPFKGAVHCEVALGSLLAEMLQHLSEGHNAQVSEAGEVFQLMLNLCVAIIDTRAFALYWSFQALLSCLLSLLIFPVSRDTVPIHNPGFLHPCYSPLTPSSNICSWLHYPIF